MTTEFLIVVFAAIAGYFYGEHKKNEGEKIGKKINLGKQMTKTDLVVGALYKVYGIAFSDEGNKNPRFAFAQLNGKKYPESTEPETFAVDLASADVINEKGDLRISPGDIITLDENGYIEVISPAAENTKNRDESDHPEFCLKN